MRPRAKLLIACPRCGLGNRLRVMVSAIHFAKLHQVRLAHLWRKASPVTSKRLFEDERLGANACDFESLFESVDQLEPFVYEGQSVRLLAEHPDMCLHQGIGVVELERLRNWNISDEQFLEVDAVAIHTSLAMKFSDEEKIQIFHEYFTPRKRFLDALETKNKELQGRWLGVHLRTNHRKAFGLDEWHIDEVLQATRQVLAHYSFDRVVVFSDSSKSRDLYINRLSHHVQVDSLDWDTDDYIDNMFLDFLALSKASCILGTGLSSFSQEASLFGGGIPLVDMLLASRN